MQIAEVELRRARIGAEEVGDRSLTIDDRERGGVSVLPDGRQGLDGKHLSAARDIREEHANSHRPAGKCGEVPAQIREIQDRQRERGGDGERWRAPVALRRRLSAG